MASTADSQWTNSALANEFVNCYNYDCYLTCYNYDCYLTCYNYDCYLIVITMTVISHISAGAWAAYDQHNSAMTYRQEDNKRVLISEKN